MSYQVNIDTQIKCSGRPVQRPDQIYAIAENPAIDFAETNGEAQYVHVKLAKVVVKADAAAAQEAGQEYDGTTCVSFRPMTLNDIQCGREIVVTAEDLFGVFTDLDLMETGYTFKMNVTNE